MRQGIVGAAAKTAERHRLIQVWPVAGAFALSIVKPEENLAQLGATIDGNDFTACRENNRPESAEVVPPGLRESLMLIKFGPGRELSWLDADQAFN